MLRPLDQALIDFQKTYRQTFKQPLYQHEQYTKRQLIYNYAAVGSLFINNILENQPSDKTNQFDLQVMIKMWNDQSLTHEQMTNSVNGQKDKPQNRMQVEEDSDERNFRKQIELIKKQKLPVKHRLQRNINFRKQLQQLFKIRNLNMLSVQSMRSHFTDLKPYISYNSKNRGKRDRETDRFSDRQSDDYRDSRRNDSYNDYQRRNYERENYRKNQQRERKYEDYREQKKKGEGYRQKVQGASEGQSLQSRQNSYYNLKPSCYSQAQFTPQSQYTISQYSQKQTGNQKFPQNEIISHNQNYQAGYDSRRMYPQPSQPSSYFQYEASLPSPYHSLPARNSSTDLNKIYPNQ